MDRKKYPNINTLWAQLLIEEFTRQGVEYFCLAPGSRSSPLSMSAAMNPRAKTFVHFDERGLAFHALGYVSATNRPAVIISTSGTAAANFLPAVIEASKKKLPLIAITADRPPELRKSGADQTIEQPKIFGQYVRWDFDMPCPTEDIQPAVVLTTIAQAVYYSQRIPRGPVHLNCMFREPLAPIGTGEDFSFYLERIENWINSNEPFTSYVAPTPTLSAARSKQIAATLKNIKNGLIVVGKLGTDADRKGVIALAKKLGWPVFPDVTSGLRLGNKDANVIHHYDHLLVSEKLTEQFPVDGVLHLGGRITAKRYYQFIAAKAPEHYVMVLNHPLRNDPLHNVSVRMESGVETFCAAILPLVKSRTHSQLTILRKLSNLVHFEIETRIKKQNSLSEPAAARIISQNIPQDSGLFLASSMPIRDMDMFADAHGNAPTIGANRGASGIDGTLAAAAGFSYGLNKPTTVFLGDIAFLHDLNSLAMFRDLPQPAVIVVLNNNGGGIFSFLPIAQFDKVSEKCFGTPHGLRFTNAARMFQLNYEQPKTRSEFVKVYKKALNSKKATVIEIITDRKQNVQDHMDIQDRIRVKIEEKI